MDNHQPILSIIVISHNQKNELKRCVDSVLAQNIPFEYEIILSDDRSDDGTFELAKEYGISPVTLAVAYSKHFDFVASTIIGARTLNQLDESLAAFKFKIDDELLFKIEIIPNNLKFLRVIGNHFGR